MHRAPGCKDHRINIDYTPIRQFRVGSTSNWWRSDGLCDLGLSNATDMFRNICWGSSVIFRNHMCRQLVITYLTSCVVYNFIYLAWHTGSLAIHPWSKDAPDLLVASTAENDYATKTCNMYGGQYQLKSAVTYVLATRNQLVYTSGLSQISLWTYQFAQFKSLDGTLHISTCRATFSMRRTLSLQVCFLCECINNVRTYQFLCE